MRVEVEMETRVGPVPDGRDAQPDDFLEPVWQAAGVVAEDAGGGTVERLLEHVLEDELVVVEGAGEIGGADVDAEHDEEC